MPDYDDNEETNYIIYADASNLYGCSMSAFLPSGKLKFVNEFDLDKLLTTLVIPMPTQSMIILLIKIFIW